MNVYGIWKGTIGAWEGRSHLVRSFHQWPLKVAKPFAGKDGELILYLQDASPGLFNGDVQEVECTLEKRARLILTTPSSCKLHPSQTGGVSRQVQRFVLQEGAVLEYFPEPLVPYAGANYFGKMELHMSHGAQALMAEIVTPGRIGRGESFAYERVRSELSVYWHGRLAVWDSLLLEPARWDTRFGLFDQYTHLATCWALSEKAESSHVAMLQDLLETDADGGRDGSEEVYTGVSLLEENGIVVRMLGHSVRQLQARIQDCWNLLRREWLGRDPLLFRK